MNQQRRLVRSGERRRTAILPRAPRAAQLCRTRGDASRSSRIFHAARDISRMFRDELARRRVLPVVCENHRSAATRRGEKTSSHRRGRRPALSCAEDCCDTDAKHLGRLALLFALRSAPDAACRTAGEHEAGRTSAYSCSGLGQTDTHAVMFLPLANRQRAGAEPRTVYHRDTARRCTRVRRESVACRCVRSRRPCQRRKRARRASSLAREPRRRGGERPSHEPSSRDGAAVTAQRTTTRRSTQPLPRNGSVPSLSTQRAAPRVMQRRQRLTRSAAARETAGRQTAAAST